MRDKIKLAKHIVYASRAAKVAKASRFGIMASAVLTFLIFAISYYGQRVGNFTFVVDRMATRAGITMFENFQTRAETSLLYAPRVDNADGMTALCGTEFTFVQPGSDLCVPSDEVVSAVDGNNSDYSYLAYTFYVANAGDKLLFLLIAFTEMMNIIREVGVHKKAELLKAQEALIQEELKRLRGETAPTEQPQAEDPR